MKIIYNTHMFRCLFISGNHNTYVIRQKVFLTASGHCRFSSFKSKDVLTCSNLHCAFCPQKLWDDSVTCSFYLTLLGSSNHFQSSEFFCLSLKERHIQFNLFWISQYILDLSAVNWISETSKIVFSDALVPINSEAEFI